MHRRRRRHEVLSHPHRQQTAFERVYHTLRIDNVDLPLSLSNLEIDGTVGIHFLFCILVLSVLGWVLG